MKDIVINLAGEKADFSLNDRGLSYGDGVFETILVHAGEPVWWREHWERFARGAEVLKISQLNEGVVRNACDEILDNSAHCVLKIILTRGSGGRGYCIPAEQDPRIIISLHQVPAPIQQPVNLCWCDTKLARQPLLAGIKHLNRLEQVLARNEWQDAGIFDGLMCDTENNATCATSANVFAKINGQWFTPEIVQAGIAGIARAWVLKQWPLTQEAYLSRLQLEQAESIFICNAVRGILAVKCLGKTVFSLDQDIPRLQSQLALEQPAFAMGEHRGK
jgi:4-amino-4-deoxychorismate lyase